MALTLVPLLLDTDIDFANALAVRPAYVREHEVSGLRGILAVSADAEVFEYTRNQSAITQRLPAAPPRLWVVFIREGCDQARLRAVVENRGEISNDGYAESLPLPSLGE